MKILNKQNKNQTPLGHIFEFFLGKPRMWFSVQIFDRFCGSLFSRAYSKPVPIKKLAMLLLNRQKKGPSVSSDQFGWWTGDVFFSNFYYFWRGDLEIFKMT